MPDWHSLTGAEFCWVVDPNDGTSDFLQGRRGSAISVGLLRNAVPVLGVVYAPVTPERGPDCISWSKGLGGIHREMVLSRLEQLDLVPGSKVLMSTAAANKPELNAELCAPADFIPMPSIAYCLALAAAGDAIAGASLASVPAHDVVAGHALLINARGVLLDQHGEHISYESEERLSQTSLRCFGGASRACQELLQRRWDEVIRHVIASPNLAPAVQRGKGAQKLIRLARLSGLRHAHQQWGNDLRAESFNGPSSHRPSRLNSQKCHKAEESSKQKFVRHLDATDLPIRALHVETD